MNETGAAERKALSGKQRRYLRGLGNRLQPAVSVGLKGINESVLRAINQAFEHADLIKIKLQEGFTGDRHETAEQLARAANAELVQVLGKTILLYQRHPETPKIMLPNAS